MRDALHRQAVRHFREMLARVILPWLVLALLSLAAYAQTDGEGTIVIMHMRALVRILVVDIQTSALANLFLNFVSCTHSDQRW